MSTGLTGCAISRGSPIAGPTHESSPLTHYRDGTYAAMGWCGSCPTHHEVTVPIRTDAVVDVQVTTPAVDPTSRASAEVAAALPTAVIDRELDALNIDRRAGTSGWSEGITNTLDPITDAATVT